MNARPPPDPTSRPRSSGSARGRADVAPAVEDRGAEPPRRLDLVGAREERRVAEHAVEQQALVRLGRLHAERRPVQEVHVHRLDAQRLRPAPSHRSAARCPRRAGCAARARWARSRRSGSVRRRPRRSRKRRVRHAAELDRDLGRALRHPLAGADVERAFPPSASCRCRAERDERLARESGSTPLLLAIAGNVLPRPSPPRTARAPCATARRRDGSGGSRAAPSPSRRAPLGLEARRRLHRDQRDQLHHVVLHDVAQRAGLLVVAPRPSTPISSATVIWT